MEFRVKMELCINKRWSNSSEAQLHELSNKDMIVTRTIPPVSADSMGKCCVGQLEECVGRSLPHPALVPRGTVALSLCPEHLVLEDEEDYPTPPVTPAVWGDSASSADLQVLYARPPCAPLPGDAATAVPMGDQESAVARIDVLREDPPQIHGEVDNAQEENGRAPANDRDGPSDGGEMDGHREHVSTISTPPPARRGRENEEDMDTGARQSAAASPATVHSTFVTGRISGKQLLAEMEDFFMDNEDDQDRHERSRDGGRGTSSAPLGGELDLVCAGSVEIKDKPGYFPTKISGASGEGRAEVHGPSNTRGPVGFGGLLSEEISEFLYAEDDDGDNSSVTPRRRMRDNTSSRGGDGNQACRSQDDYDPSQRDEFSTVGAGEGPTRFRGGGGTRDVRLGISSEAGDRGDAEANGDHLQDFRAIQPERSAHREEFDDFLFSDDDDNGGSIGRDEGGFPAQRRSPPPRIPSRETAVSLGDDSMCDKWRLVESSRTKRSNGGRDGGHGSNLVGEEQPSPDGEALTWEETVRFPRVADSVYDFPPRPRNVGEDDGSDDAGGDGDDEHNGSTGGTPPSASIGESTWPAEQSAIVSDCGATHVGGRGTSAGARRTTSASGGDVGHARLSAAPGGAGAGSYPAGTTLRSSRKTAPQDRDDDDNGQARLSSWGPTGRDGLEELDATPGTESPPLEKGSGCQVGTPSSSRTATITMETIPSRGSRVTGGRAAMGSNAEIRKDHDSAAGGNGVGGLSKQGPFLTGGNNSRWEVRKRPRSFSWDYYRL